ncbi:dihydroanticapsin dehydrogenase [Rhizobiales bacterium GAS191]|jgi:NAD(P)-dependent dehydrogenase (short-subunit alcohol dehydrogenase family)|nr:dihydroanticapsin dehydrogenase [Rhizobiales bacterium GAS113]SEB88870.1 dihydroanticapsin dehydrogenase [Rhizobiales bacterium GAS188]SED35450.1 dihydroanticapsin dehydrogenase [Rhizobiales bacterium GAS191]
MPGRLEGKRVIFTGGVNNIGGEAVRLFVAEGAKVVIGDIDDAGGRAAAQRLGAAAHFIRVDVTDEASVRHLIEEGADWLGGLDALCQNAGLQYAGPIAEFDAERWDRLFAVNARALFFGAKYAIAHLKASGKGAIVNMASLAGKRGAAGVAAYSASKGAAVALGTALALELAADNIRVNTICPGWVDTPFNQAAIDFMGGRARQDMFVKQLVPLGRQAQPSEIAPLFVYLASDESSYMTGQALVIDGGVYN